MEDTENIADRPAGQKPGVAYEWAAKLLEIAHQDRDEILARIVPGSVKSNYIMGIYDAVEAMLETKVYGNDRSIQMLILTTYVEQKREIAAIFNADEDRDIMAKINDAIGFTLLHVLISGDDNVAKGVADCVVKTADERMERALKVLAKNEGEKRIGKRAAAILGRIETERRLSLMLPHLKTPRADIQIDYRAPKAVFKIR
jgi:hypothetical protein